MGFGPAYEELLVAIAVHLKTATPQEVTADTTIAHIVIYMAIYAE